MIGPINPLAHRPDEAFGPLRALGERQLQIQITRSSMYDTQAMGLLAVNAALAAAIIAAKDPIGHLWCLGLLGLLASSLPSVAALGYIGFRRDEGFGPRLKPLLIPAETYRAEAMNKILATGIADAVVDNDHHLKRKRKRVLWGIGLLATTLICIIAVVLFF